MSEIVKSKTFKVLSPMLVGILGTLFAMTFPVLHGQFCAGLPLVGV